MVILKFKYLEGSDKRVKIKIDQKVYLQKYDVAYIVHELNFIQASIIEEIFGSGKPFIMNGPVDGYAFKCVFENPENVRWLMEQDWIVDYNQYKDKSPEEMLSICEKVVEDGTAEVKEFNARDANYREEHFLEYKAKFDNLEHEVRSLEIMLDYLKNKVEFIFPEETNDHRNTSKPTKKSGFFARLFGRGTH